jgi:predicted DNA-binding transcriptional regulator
MSRSIYQNKWASIARMLIALQRDLRTTLFPRKVGVVDGFMLEALLLRIYLWQLEGTPVTVSMLSRSLGVSRATCRRKLATLIEWEFIKREGQTYHIVLWMGEADQRRMLNRITAILSHATTEMALAKLATSGGALELTSRVRKVAPPSEL